MEMKRKGILIIIITIIFFSLSMAHASDESDMIITSENNENNQNYLEISNNETTLQKNLMDNEIINANEEYEYPQLITIKVDENIENLNKYNNITIKVNLTMAWSCSEDDYYNTLNNNNFKIYENDAYMKYL